MSNELIEIVLCKDHFQKVAENRVCDECPSRPENMRRVLERAGGEDANFRGKLVTLMYSQQTSMKELLMMMEKLNKTIWNVGLLALSLCIVVVLAGMLWFAKIDTKTFDIGVGFVLSPWYGTGLARALNLSRSRELIVASICFSAILFSAILLLAVYYL